MPGLATARAFEMAFEIGPEWLLLLAQPFPHAACRVGSLPAINSWPACALLLSSRMGSPLLGLLLALMAGRTSIAPSLQGRFMDVMCACAVRACMHVCVCSRACA